MLQRSPPDPSLVQSAAFSTGITAKQDFVGFVELFFPIQFLPFDMAAEAVPGRLHLEKRACLC